jgi:hypothetical protein
MSRHPKPEPFLEIRVQLREAEAELAGFCAGYETNQWRAEAFARHLIDNLQQFALPIEEWDMVNSATAVRLLRRAAKTIYTTDKYHHRGEIGELILFTIMRHFYNSEPIVSKFYFKSSSNDTVKGFDCVHVVPGFDGPELRLGEVKFYSDVSAAIRDARTEIDQHLEVNYLREEFLWIEHKMGGGTQFAEDVKRWLDESTSLDEVFRVVHVPVLITYDSTAVNKHRAVTEAYRSEVAVEIAKHFRAFLAKGPPRFITVHVLFLPLAAKASLVDAFDRRLKALQEL